MKSEQRQYVRMDTVFPVEMKIIHLSRQDSGLPLLIQGFTRDVGLGGLCLEFRAVTAADAELLKSDESELDLLIHLPFRPKPLAMRARRSWFKQTEEHGAVTHLVGVQYGAGESADAKKIFEYAQARVRVPRIMFGAILLLITFAAGLLVSQWKLDRENHRLVNSIVDQAEKRQELKPDADTIGQTLEEILSQLISWLERHAHPRSGLLPSYEGDPKLEAVSFTYDQALGAIAFALFGKSEPARRVLSFYKERAAKSDGGFGSSYDTRSGDPVEWSVHVGPNVWIGIAALQYQRLTGDTTFLGMAQGIGQWLLDLQARDPEGGLRGGPKETWFSTEHNLDAYAFFGLLGRTTGDPRYGAAREKLFDWILKNAADRTQGTFKRGKGDATIATDTFSWSIAAIGPERLAQNQLDPEGIMAFAEEHCRVETEFDRPDGRKVQVTGFDFSKPQNQGRGGIVSSEWTAQAIVTFRILEKFFEKSGDTEKSEYYRGQSEFYLNELQKMIISSLSRTGQGRGCLPYATAADAETGHGWRTPAGKQTGSVAGTAYGVFAWTGFNPFDDAGDAGE